MKLNLDCIRDLLLCLEEKTELNEACHLNKVYLETICACETMKSYNQNDIVYSLFKLIEAGFIIGNISCEEEKTMMNTAFVKDITWNGHEFLHTIKAEANRQAVHSGVKNSGIIVKPALSILEDEISKSKAGPSEFMESGDHNHGSVLFQKKEEEDLNKTMRLLKSNLCVSMRFPFISFAGKWCQDEDGWYYQNVDGSNLNDEWFLDRNNKMEYHFDTFGTMNTGMAFIENKWYHFDETDGHLIVNYYNPSDCLISTNDGVVVTPEMPGLTLGVVSYHSEHKIVIFFRITNMRNAPVTIGPRCIITDSKINKEFFLFDNSEFADSVTIGPKEEKTAAFAAPDANPVNITNGITRVRYELTSEETSYWIAMPICDREEIKDYASIKHIDP